MLMFSVQKNALLFSEEVYTCYFSGAGFFIIQLTDFQ